MPKKNQKKKAVLLGNPLEAKNKLSEISSNIIPEKAFETVLERLEREFPHVAQEIIEEIYEENVRSYISTKKKLEEIFPICEDENTKSNLNSKEINFTEKNQAYSSLSNCINNYFKEAETNYTDETDKVSCKTEKSKNEKSDFSNDLSRQISGSNSNLSGNANAETYCNNEDNSNTNNNPVLINLSYSKKGNKKAKTRAYDISELVNGSESLANQTTSSKKQSDSIKQIASEINMNGNNNQTKKLKPIKDLIAFKFEDNFLSSDEEKPNLKHGAKNKNNFNLNNNTFNIKDAKKVSNFKSNNNNNDYNNNQKNESKNNFFNKENKQGNFEVFQYNGSSSKNLNPEEII